MYYDTLLYNPEACGVVVTSTLQLLASAKSLSIAGNWKLQYRDILQGHNVCTVLT
jgi:hypothetical protein